MNKHFSPLALVCLLPLFNACMALPKPEFRGLKTPSAQDENGGAPAPSGQTSSSQASAGPEEDDPSRPEVLLVSEVLYDAAESDTDGNVFVELYGTPGGDVGGYQVVLVNGSDGSVYKIITLPSSSKLKENGVFLIADLQDKAKTSHVAGADLLENFDPQNGPDAVQLLDAGGNLLDVLAYGEGGVETGKNGLAAKEGGPAPKVKSGRSLARKSDEDTQDNSLDFIELDVPSPGQVEFDGAGGAQTGEDGGDEGGQAPPPAGPEVEDPSPPEAEAPEVPPPDAPEMGPEAAGVVLNEVFYDALAGDTDGNAFIELHGPPGFSVGGFQILLVNGDDGNVVKTLTLPQDAQISKNGVFVAADAKADNAGTTDVTGADLIDNFDPQNGPDGVQLLDAQGNLLDGLAYGDVGVSQAVNGLAVGEGSPAADVAAGHSLSRVGGADSGDNAADFVDLETPTPGVL